MKSKNVNKKLVLNKTTISHLGYNQMHAINGGATEIIGCTGTCTTIDPRKCPVPSDDTTPGQTSPSLCCNTYPVPCNN